MNRHCIRDLTITQHNRDELNHLNKYVSLQSLVCTGQDLLELPFSLPKTLKILQCDENRLVYLPPLPETLRELICNNNQLTILPDLPLNMIDIQCQNNQLSVLPELPPKLETLMCFDNQLTELPALPKSIISMGCAGNYLIQLPELESLKDLWCEENYITHLPFISDSLREGNWYDNPCDECDMTLEEVKQYQQENPPYFEPIFK